MLTEALLIVTLLLLVQPSGVPPAKQAACDTHQVLAAVGASQLPSSFEAPMKKRPVLIVISSLWAPSTKYQMTMLSEFRASGRASLNLEVVLLSPDDEEKRLDEFGKAHKDRLRAVGRLPTDVWGKPLLVDRVPTSFLLRSDGGCVRFNGAAQVGQLIDSINDIPLP